jgi:hypothetical protein
MGAAANLEDAAAAVISSIQLVFDNLKYNTSLLHTYTNLNKQTRLTASKVSVRTFFLFFRNYLLETQ